MIPRRTCRPLLVLVAAAGIAIASGGARAVQITVSDQDLQVITEWGCATMQYNSAIGQYPLGATAVQEALLVDLGISIWRQAIVCAMGNDDGSVTVTHMTEVCDNIAMHASWGQTRYIISVWSAAPGLKTQYYNGSWYNDQPVMLREDAEATFVNYLVDVLDFIRDDSRDLALPVAFSMANEPHNPAPYDQMWWEAPQYIRVVKALRTAMDDAGYASIPMFGPEEGREVNTDDILADTDFSALATDPALDDALAILAGHSYDWGGDLTAEMFQTHWVTPST